MIIVSQEELKWDEVGYGRPRDSEKIRRDALAKATAKFKEGCGGCAEEYLLLASRHGASSEEIDQVTRRAASAEVPGGVGRREFLQRAGTLAAGASVLASTGVGILSETSRARADPMPKASSVGWCLVSTSSSPRHLIGLNPDGTLVGDINAYEQIILRSQDASRLYLVASIASASGTASTVVTVVDAIQGRVLGSVVGATLDLGGGLGSDMIWPALSPDGRWLAIAHQTDKVVGPSSSVVKQSLSRTLTHSVAQTNLTESLELIDLGQNASTGLVELGAFPGYARGARLVFTSDGARLFLIKEDDSRTQPRVWSSLGTFGVTSGGLTSTSCVAGSDGPNSLPSFPNLLHGPAYMIAGDAAIARLANLALVQIIDTRTLTVEEADIRPSSRRGARAFAPAAVCSADGTTLYVADSYAGIVQSVSTQTGTVMKAFRASDGTAFPSIVAGVPNHQTLALSADGDILYFVDCINGGIQLLDASSLQPHGAILTGLPLRSVSPAPDGSVAYAQSIDQKTVYVIDGAARVTAAAPIAGRLSHFVEAGQWVI